MVLTYLVPHNVEASTMALISGVLVWSYEVGAKISASIYCQIFDVDEEHMDNYPHVLEAKLPAIVLLMLLTIIIPRNEDVSRLAAWLRKKHIRRRDKYTNKLKMNQDSDEEMLMNGDDQEGGGREPLSPKFVPGSD